MAGSRANWENQTGEKLSSFERSKRDIAKNVADVRKNTQTKEPAESTEITGGLVGKAINDILGYRQRQKKAIDEAQ